MLFLILLSRLAKLPTPLRNRGLLDVLSSTFKHHDVCVYAPQLSRRVLYVNISAAIPVDVAPDASEGDVRAAVNVKSLSADGPINLLANNPDKFFGRTTKACIDLRQLQISDTEPLQTPYPTHKSRRDNSSSADGPINLLANNPDKFRAHHQGSCAARRQPPSLTPMVTALPHAL